MIWGALQTLNEDACEDIREDQEAIAEAEEEEHGDEDAPPEKGQFTPAVTVNPYRDREVTFTVYVLRTLYTDRGTSDTRTIRRPERRPWLLCTVRWLIGLVKCIADGVGAASDSEGKRLCLGDLGEAVVSR